MAELGYQYNFIHGAILGDKHYPRSRWMPKSRLSAVKRACLIEYFVAGQ